MMDAISPPLHSPLAHFRTKINTLDESIIQLLAQRQRVIEQVAIYKHENHLPSVIPQRIQTVLLQVKEWALKYDVDATMMAQIYQIVIQSACELEEKLIQEQSK